LSSAADLLSSFYYIYCYYEPVDIQISHTEMAELSEQHPTRWWQRIGYYIRMWRRIDFASCQVCNIV